MALNLSCLFNVHFQSVAGDKLSFYRGGTTTAITVTDSDGTPILQPVVADANGLFTPIFVPASSSGTYLDYKAVWTSSANVVKQTIDHIPIVVGLFDWGNGVPVNNTLLIQYSDDGASEGPDIQRRRISASPAAGDQIGTDYYAGYNSTQGLIAYATAYARIVDPVAGTEDGEYRIKTIVAGTDADRIRIRDRVYLMVSAAEQTMPYMLSGTATYDPPNLADGAGTTTTVTVTGAALGDIAAASFSLTTSGITITAWVSNTDTVSVRFQNESGGALDIASGTLKGVVFK